MFKTQTDAEAVIEIIGKDCTLLSRGSRVPVCTDWGLMHTFEVRKNIGSPMVSVLITSFIHSTGFRIYPSLGSSQNVYQVLVVLKYCHTNK